ncbi:MULTISPECIES: N-acetylglucosamine/diacetylchitobiose ABC transporter substrate-binding protein [Streptomycetaceae]|uniref:Putative extracellular solute-binding receptor n=1 Tax=Streptantibioticus cattleyicolor (strain ATCC 35852 / DSM 46488 / JCM 4925 / NBRC 14057 / NRRL 8057) TaxID=1003195 RepID=F8JWN7_STREN|nr:MULTISPECIES: N-acetylglucosamine/diacetylchitobiose ABC transporter substrate-binding protein [Streptomycetaceae]AEW97034.1 putative extracellular solute-binding receptor [Streptantibioticus cattleyicolor NRRL 8057 = DSM 46488]MYS61500.1 carbohydrate ABC transporter, N-acetylglucosamine/diacetylchitobiose-binding protein [Streptomyces sp. SID5468]CCB77360.1 ABC transporter solute-binding protein [Streptantibioticus cattleyicolor NRRL 8057 = DSM 46488]
MGSTIEPNRLNRRDLIKRAAALGIAAVPVTGLLSACAASGGGGGGGKQESGKKSATNPFGVADSAALEVVIFKGGFGDDYAKRFESLYAKEHPKAKVSHTATQNITGLLQPRLNAGNPPDVVDDSGNAQIKLDVLEKAGQLADLGPLLDAPSVDDPSKKVRDILMPGTVDLGTVNGKFCSLQYVYTVFGLWYSGKLFKQHGWTAPKTWADFLSLGGEIKKAGIAPFAHQGKYPYYINVAIVDLIIKNGGLDTLKRIDSLDDSVWDGDAAKHAIEAVYELVDKDYLLPGTNGMTHIEAQTAWNQYRAAFVPCGAWLENEQLKATPSDFEMTFTPMPSLPGDKLPFEAIRGGANEPYIVPKNARNVAGGLEFMRQMLSKAGATAFAQTANSLTVVKDGIDPGISLRPGTRSTVTALKAAGANVFNPTYMYTASSLDVDMGNASAELMAKRIKPAEWLNRVKAATRKAKNGGE